MISRSKKLTSTEKKLQVLKTQLYGKDTVPTGFSPTPKTDYSQKNFSFKETSATISSPVATSTSDITHLKYDLLKTCFLAGGLIILQLVILFSGLSSKLRF